MSLGPGGTGFPLVPPSDINTRKPAASFAITEIAPPSQAYFAADDFLHISFISSTAAQGVLIRGRFLDVFGQIKPFEFQKLVTGAFTTTTVDLPLGEGYLLGLTIIPLGTPTAWGVVFASASISRSFQFSANFHQMLASAYVTVSAPLSWPNKTVYNGLETQGAIRPITGTVPAAGAEISETVPSGVRWRLISITMNLVSSATVATRQPRLTIDDGATSLSTNGNENTGATAGQTNFYLWGPYQSTLVNTQGVSRGGMLPHILTSGFRIRTNTVGLQAGDQWTAPVYEVEEWLTQQ